MVAVTALDVAAVVFLICVVILSARRGFASASCGLVGTLISVLCAIVASGTLPPAIIRTLKNVVGGALEEQLMETVPGGAERLSQEAAVMVLGDMELRAFRPLVFALVFFAVLSLWLYACLHLNLLSHFPAMERFDQLAGAGLGIVKGAVLLAGGLYVLTTLGILPAGELEKSLLLGPLVRLWRRLI